MHRQLRAEYGAGWLTFFAAFYMGQKRTCELANTCTLPSLSVDIERSDPDARTAYEEELRQTMEALAAGLPTGTTAERQARAWAILSLLPGGVTLARAVQDQGTSEQIAEAVQGAVKNVAGGPSSV